MAIKLDRPLYLTADKKIVEEGDPAARFVLGVAGSEINDADAKLYGLEEYLKAGGYGKKAAPPAANKATGPAENKGK